jgi:hypothetical protein
MMCPTEQTERITAQVFQFMRGFRRHEIYRTGRNVASTVPDNASAYQLVEPRPQFG